MAFSHRFLFPALSDSVLFTFFSDCMGFIFICDMIQVMVTSYRIVFTALSDSALSDIALIGFYVSKVFILNFQANVFQTIVKQF